MRPFITAVVIYKYEYYPRVFIVVQRIPIVIFFLISYSQHFTFRLLIR